LKQKIIVGQFALLSVTCNHNRFMCHCFTQLPVITTALRVTAQSTLPRWFS